MTSEFEPFSLCHRRRNGVQGKFDPVVAHEYTARRTHVPGTPR
jgi:hypothetical protein